MDSKLADVMEEINSNLADAKQQQQRLDSLVKRFRAAHIRLNMLKQGGKRRLPRTPSCRSRLFISESDIRDLAHSYWVKEGYPEGRAMEHWLRAENELMHKNNDGFSSGRTISSI